eukprot:gene35482-56617_t
MKGGRNIALEKIIAKANLPCALGCGLEARKDEMIHHNCPK